MFIASATLRLTLRGEGAKCEECSVEFVPDENHIECIQMIGIGPSPVVESVAQKFL